MKTAISIPDDVFVDAERLARLLGTSRSHLYTEALREYLVRHDADAVTDALNRVCEEVETQVDPAFGNATRILLAHVEW